MRRRRGGERKEGKGRKVGKGGRERRREGRTGEEERREGGEKERRQGGARRTQVKCVLIQSLLAIIIITATCTKNAPLILSGTFCGGME